MFVLTAFAAVVTVGVGRSMWNNPLVSAPAGAQPVVQPRPVVREDPARPDSCPGKDLRVVKQDMPSDGGTFYGRLIVTNTGRQSCTLQGHAVIREIQADHVVLRSQAISASVDNTNPMVSLRPKQNASAVYSFTAADSPNCPRHERTEVILPHTRSAVPLNQISSKTPPGQQVCQYRVQPFAEGVSATWQEGS
jgi:hypothetical protein